MRIIDRSLDGGVLVKVAAEEVQRFVALGQALALLEGASAARDAEPAPAPKPENAKPCNAPRASKPSGNMRSCAVCGATFRAATSAIICSRECRKKRDRLLYAKRAKKKRAAQYGKAAEAIAPIETRNPADPSLTPEERLAIRARLIEQKARAHKAD